MWIINTQKVQQCTGIAVHTISIIFFKVGREVFYQWPKYNYNCILLYLINQHLCRIAYFTCINSIICYETIYFEVICWHLWPYIGKAQHLEISDNVLNWRDRKKTITKNEGKVNILILSIFLYIHYLHTVSVFFRPTDYNPTKCLPFL